MVGNGQVLVVRQQRRVGAEQFADGGGVMDAGIKVGVVTDLGRQRQRAILRGVKMRADLRGGLRRTQHKKSTVSLDFRLLTPYFITVCGR